VGEDQLTTVVEDEPDVEEPLRPLGMACLRLSHQVDAVLTADLAERLGLRTRHVDRAGFREGGVVEVEHLVVEPLERALRQRDQSDRQIERGEPARRLHQVTVMLDVAHDVGSLRDPPHGRDESDGVVRLDHLPPRASGGHAQTAPNDSCRAARCSSTGSSRPLCARRTPGARRRRDGPRSPVGGRPRHPPGRRTTDPRRRPTWAPSFRHRKLRSTS
jgi:hypothetical protein